MKQGRSDIAVNALSRLAFPVGWDNPARLRSCADKVMAQIDKVDDPATRAEVKLRALSLRDVSGTWSADHAAMASDALREMSGIEDPVRLACARITHSWLQLRHAKYGAVISEVEDALRIVLQHRCVEVYAPSWFSDGRYFTLVNGVACILLSHLRRRTPTARATAGLKRSSKLSLLGCLLNVASTATRANCVRRRCNAQYIPIKALVRPCVM